jgi:hypothetical protein
VQLDHKIGPCRLREWSNHSSSCAGPHTSVDWASFSPLRMTLSFACHIFFPPRFAHDVFRFSFRTSAAIFVIAVAPVRAPSGLPLSIVIAAVAGSPHGDACSNAIHDPDPVHPVAGVANISSGDPSTGMGDAHTMRDVRPHSRTPSAGVCLRNCARRADDDGDDYGDD